MTCAADVTGRFYLGTRADLAPDGLLALDVTSNYAERKLSWIYFSGTLDAAIWGCELAKGEGRERISIVEPTDAFEGDPNLTHKALCSTCPRQVCARRSPATPAHPEFVEGTQSYRSHERLRVVDEVATWEPHPPN